TLNHFQITPLKPLIQRRCRNPLHCRELQYFTTCVDTNATRGWRRRSDADWLYHVANNHPAHAGRSPTKTLCRGSVWGVIIVARAAQCGLSWALVD
ncbi:MAG: hypothetical protein JWN70_2897, partial [Planctomycetaceae bacterium]|nr:hypothetical protein [Planctomycetaceae bacterium]